MKKSEEIIEKQKRSKRKPRFNTVVDRYNKPTQ